MPQDASLPGLTLTGVGWYFSAAHRSADGVLHGHTWEVVAWWHEGGDAVALQGQLRDTLAEFDHVLIPDPLTTGEALARRIGAKLQRAADGLRLHSIEISRPAERIFARWTAG